ncbi:MAG: hypothetical protein KKB45_11485 [Gammaproteobacteria bacterium]|jgi:hypothetical protein|nr:hypothetical protein [Gammaproteobacteria bacterium]MBU2279415.1 hypothetical protein [Gammaproteobacteria bacterium]
MKKTLIAATALFTSQLAFAAAPDCGTWVTSQVEVCDERVVMVDKPVTHCNYISLPYETHQFTKTVDGHISFGQCGKMNGYYLNGIEHTTKQVRTTVRENCRMETRWVWVPGGPNCGEHPQNRLSTPETPKQ